MTLVYPSGEEFTHNLSTIFTKFLHNFCPKKIARDFGIIDKDTRKKGTIMLYITFQTVSDAQRFEKTLQTESIPVTLRPVPRDINASCGTCAEVDAKYELAIVNLVEEKGLRVHEIVYVE